MDKVLAFQIGKIEYAKVQRNKPVYDQRGIGNYHG